MFGLVDEESRREIFDILIGSNDSTGVKQENEELKAMEGYGS